MVGGEAVSGNGEFRGKSWVLLREIERGREISKGKCVLETHFGRLRLRLSHLSGPPPFGLRARDGRDGNEGRK